MAGNKLSRRYFVGLTALGVLGAVLGVATAGVVVDAVQERRERLDTLLKQHRDAVRALLANPTVTAFAGAPMQRVQSITDEIMALAREMVGKGEKPTSLPLVLLGCAALTT